ncbi:sulfhydrogenase subunit delta [Legionella micdadei]|uniref:Coenzyme F420-reducing hydrogenase, gamma subunit n=1 Tax=Legionella micdadei TaxID=451 RepID=A0A098GE38_LEGMI|nr:sulfhydrogenase subunit delta [Legionella micdadei]ARG97679.1 sulfhydrogenase subunit delta [Legionella micdadei]ARH01581.1 sulfhydrogenase subunit delta [Legionella micdadei]KTD27769.1 sulfhydrogenase subunit delta [Legionella micdadei]NSL17754.1 sulfhydrogenase subunit delta [Legionella micdadei]CEG60744.1 Sulfhydrogenase delta subunit [Legionella micdadei]
MRKPRLGVYKFTSCDGCQLAFLNAGEAFLLLSELVELTHFAEAGYLNFKEKIDIAFVEGSISTPEEVERIKKIRENATFLITIGACATAGGIQALRNAVNYQEWMASIYASPKTIETLSTSTAISHHVYVDFELWGCPVNTHQVMDAVRSLLFGAVPRVKRDAVCLECKRNGEVCVLVAKKEPCMGPITQTGCGALCPQQGRACYACYGPSENANARSLGAWFAKNGSSYDKIARQFLHINNQAEVFNQTGNYFKGIKIVKE